jgi:hypothetical protein
MGDMPIHTIAKRLWVFDGAPSAPPTLRERGDNKMKQPRLEK